MLVLPLKRHFMHFVLCTTRRHSYGDVVMFHFTRSQSEDWAAASPAKSRLTTLPHNSPELLLHLSVLSQCSNMSDPPRLRLLSSTIQLSRQESSPIRPERSIVVYHCSTHQRTFWLCRLLVAILWLSRPEERLFCPCFYAVKVPILCLPISVLSRNCIWIYLAWYFMVPLSENDTSPMFLCHVICSTCSDGLV